MDKHKLKNRWSVWFHQLNDLDYNSISTLDEKDWKYKGYKEIYRFETLEDFWYFYNNHPTLGMGIYFLMKDGILPKWDAKENSKGGTWSLKILPNENKDIKLEKIVYNVWEKASIQLINNLLIDNNERVNGISIQLKSRSNCGIIQIWCKDTAKKLENFSIENVDMDNMLKYFKENNNRRDKFKEYRKKRY